MYDDDLKYLVEEKFKAFPDPLLAQTMWGEEAEESKCVGCNRSAKYVVIALCKTHYGWWLHNRHQFERKFYHD